MEKYIDFFLNNFCVCYPFYTKNLYKNIELTELLVDMYNTTYVPPMNNYITKFDRESTIELAYEVLESISPFIANRYLKEVKNGVINFGNYGFSSTKNENNNYNIYVHDEGNIVTPMISVHEFFHLLHLEKCNYNLDDENYYCYTEALGMAADFYFIMYVVNNKKDLVDDIKEAISEYYIRIYKLAKDSLVDGLLISIYNDKNKLSKKYIKQYVEENKLNEKYKKIMSYKEYACLDYYENIRYIYSLPQALIIAYKLYNEEQYRNNFIDMINDFEYMDYIKWADKYYNCYIKDDKIYELFRLLRCNMYNLYKGDEKVKKLGGI